MRNAVLSIFFAFYCSIVFAQKVIDLDPAIVTTSRISQKNSTTGRHVTVITAEDISKLPVNSIDELLKYAAGVEVQQRGTAGSQADISIRGGTFQQVLVLIDGMKLNDPITGHFSSYIPVDVSQIERIEILKGTAAAIYGSEAVGGVIHIITKTFAKENSESRSLKNVSLAAGDFGFHKEAISIHKSGKINYSAAASSANAKGQLLRTQRNAGFHNNAVSVNAALHRSKISWFFHTSLDNRNFAAENYYTTFKSDTASERVRTWWNHFKVRVKRNVSTHELDLVYKQSSDHYVFNPSSAANDNRSKVFSLQYLNTILLKNQSHITYGTSYEHKLIMSNDRGDHYNNHVAAFVSSFYKLSALRINAGVRADYDQLYDLKILPNVSLALPVKKFVFRALAGRSIRAADFTERFNNYNKVGLRSGTIGNPDLQPEEGWSYEAGIDFIRNSFKFSFTAFSRDQNNVIDFVSTPYSSIPRKDNLIPAGVYAFAQNIRKVKTSGLETEMIFRKNFSSEKFLHINLSAMLLHSSTGDSVNSFYIVSHAHSIVQNSVIYGFANWAVSLNAIYKKRKGQEANAILARITPDYILLNGKVMYTLKKLQAFVIVNNISDKSYSDLLGSSMPGRWATAGLSFTF